jgi:hypothetical protein
VDADAKPNFEHIGVYIAYPARKEYIESVLSGDIRYKNNYDSDSPRVWLE